MRVSSLWFNSVADKLNFLRGIEELDFICVQYIGSVYTFVSKSSNESFRVIKHPRSRKQTFTLLINSDDKFKYSNIINYFLGV